MQKNSYWPLDYDPEGEIYENPAWDLPGFRRRPQRANNTRRSPKPEQR